MPNNQASIFDTDPERANEFIWNLVVELDMYGPEYLSRGEPEAVAELRRAIRDAAKVAGQTEAQS